MKGLPFILVAGLVMAGCYSKPPPDTATFISPASGLRTDLLSENMLETADKTPEVIWLNAARAFEFNGKARFVLELDYLSSEEHGFLEIPAGSTLTLTIDGKDNVLSGTGSASHREKTQNNTVTERAFYTVERRLFEEITQGRKVRVEIRGKNGTVDRWFTAVNFARFIKFVDKLDQ